MGFKYQGDSTIGVSLTVQTPKPLDTRLVVDTRTDLYSIPAKYAYNGMPVVCVADGNIYTLIDKIRQEKLQDGKLLMKQFR